MSLVREVAKETSVGVGVTDTPDGLLTLYNPGCAAVIWRRSPLAGFQHWIDALEPERLPKARVILPPNDVREAVASICAAYGTPDCDQRDRLIDDVAALAEIFAGLMRVSLLRLRLDVVTSNACHRFDIDSVTARLICTYRGRGTQYSLSHEDGEPSDPVTVPTCAPIVWRGSRWPVSPPCGFSHRSPPIDGAGEARLVLALDPIASMEFPPQQRPH